MRDSGLPWLAGGESGSIQRLLPTIGGAVIAGISRCADPGTPKLDQGSKAGRIPSSPPLLGFEYALKKLHFGHPAMNRGLSFS